MDGNDVKNGMKGVRIGLEMFKDVRASSNAFVDMTPMLEVKRVEDEVTSHVQ
jgi:hypothetical protein